MDTLRKEHYQIAKQIQELSPFSDWVKSVTWYLQTIIDRDPHYRIGQSQEYFNTAFVVWLNVLNVVVNGSFQEVSNRVPDSLVCAFCKNDTCPINPNNQ